MLAFATRWANNAFNPAVRIDDFNCASSSGVKALFCLSAMNAVRAAFSASVIAVSAADPVFVMGMSLPSEHDRTGRAQLPHGDARKRINCRPMNEAIGQEI